jgi:SSS family solute:Na+ symporter
MNPARVNMADKAHSTFVSNAWTSAWQPLLQGPSANPMGVDWFAMVFGLGFVLAFGYWCTNFLVVQRAMAARNMTAARRTPLIGALPKMLLPALVILPGMLAVALSAMPSSNYRLPQKEVKKENLPPAIAAVEAVAKDPREMAALAAFADGTVAKPNEQAKDALAAISKAAGADFNRLALARVVAQQADKPLSKGDLEEHLRKAAANDYDLVVISLVSKYCPSGLLGLALTALLASFMSGMAGNVTAFNTVWTYDLYQAYIAPNKSDAHYMWMGRVVTVVGIVLSIGAAYIAANYNNAMNVIQLVFGFVNAPLFATFLLGMFSARTTSNGAFFGLLGGTGISAAFHALTITSGNAPGIKGAYLGVLQEFPSEMAQNFWLASFAFTGCFVLTLGISLLGRRQKSDAELQGLVYSLTPKTHDDQQAWYAQPGFLGVLLLIVCVIFNYIFW